MISWRRGTVRSVGIGWPGAVELQVDVDGALLPALAHPPLVGDPRVGDVVLLNVGALERGLGTGGYALVVALPERLPPDVDQAGHLVKARYTPMQVLVQGADEQGSEHHDLLADGAVLAGTPVVVAGLHSSLPAVLAGLGPDAVVVYVMTDGAALPMWFSRTVAGLRSRLAGTITVGQAFGGDLECVTLHSGLLAAVRVLGAEVVVVTQGPGNLGTGTPWGFSGVATGEAVNAAAVVGGRPIGVLRVSQADLRPRHRGISHHSVTAYGRVALSSADLPVPRSLAVDAGLFPRHRVIPVEEAGLLDLLSASPVPLSTMGRGLAEDPVAFLVAAAAGRYAAGLL